MKPIILKINDVQVSLRFIHKNKEYQCDCKDLSFRCIFKEQLSTKPSTEALVATEAVFNVRNTTSERWLVQVKDWDLIDTDGYAYKARALCDSLRPPRTLEPERSIRGAEAFSVTPGTQADFVLVFPNLKEDTEIAGVLYSDRETLKAFEIKELKPEAMDLTEARRAAMDLMQARETAEADTPSREPGLRRFRYVFKQLERKIHSRLNKILPRDTGIDLESDIQQSVLDLKQDLKFEDERTRKAAEKVLADIIEDYESELVKVKAGEEERKKLDQEVEALSLMPPREFEEWFADLLKNLGYEKVTLTPSSNDEGIDVLAEYKGLKVAVQCKRWKKSIGSPIVQTFLGAMQHAGAQRGMLITTGLFSTSAKKMAAAHPIELVDRTDLTDLIQQGLQNESSQTQ